MSYEIKFQNQKVWEFFEKHKQLNIETTNVVFVEILEMLMNHTNPSLNTELASKLLENIRTMTSQIQAINTSFEHHFTSKFLEFKKESIEDIKLLLNKSSTETSDKISPLIKQYTDSLLDKTQILISDLLPKSNESLSNNISNVVKSFQNDISKDTEKLIQSSINQESLQHFLDNIDSKFSKTLLESQSVINNIVSTSESRIDKTIQDMRTNTDHKLSNISDISNKNSESQSTLQSNISDLLKKMENSSSKGKISENILCNLLVKLYPSAEINSVGTSKETGDIIMLRKNKPQILFENKNYNTNVTQDEIRKFLRDIDTQNCCGIMMSQQSGIANKNNFEIGIQNNNVVIYIHNLEYDPDKIKTAVDIIDHFKYTLDEKDTVGERVNIDKKFLDEMNAEFSLFVNHKINHIKSIRDMTQKLVSQAEDLKIPSLENYLAKHYSSEIISQEQCPICNKYFKKGRPFDTHKRSCEKKHDNSQQKIDNLVIKT